MTAAIFATYTQLSSITLAVMAEQQLKLAQAMVPEVATEKTVVSVPTVQVLLPQSMFMELCSTVSAAMVAVAVMPAVAATPVAVASTDGAGAVMVVQAARVEVVVTVLVTSQRLTSIVEPCSMVSMVAQVPPATQVLLPVEVLKLVVAMQAHGVVSVLLAPAGVKSLLQILMVEGWTTTVQAPSQRLSSTPVHLITMARFTNLSIMAGLLPGVPAPSIR